MSDARARALAALAVAFALLAASCAGPDARRERGRTAVQRPPAPPLETGAELAADRPLAERDALSDTPDDPVLVSVGGVPVRTSDLLTSLRHRDTDLLNFHLNLLVGERLAELDAAELGLELSGALIDTRARAFEQRFASQLDGAALDDVLENELGVDPAAFRARLAGEARRELLVERVVRAWTLSQDSARMRIAVVPTDQVESLRTRFEAGESFASLARDASLDPTAREGGLVPFVVRSERSRLGRLAYRTEPATFGGPIELDPGQDVRLVFVVEERRDGLAGGWDRLRTAVESSLAEAPMDDEEFVQWQIDAEQRNGVDLAPISELVGEDLR